MTHGGRDRAADLIDQNLRMAFQQMTDEELPDRIKDLLDRLRAGEDVQTTIDEERE